MNNIKYIGNSVELEADFIENLVANGVEMTASQFKEAIGAQNYSELEHRLGYCDSQGNPHIESLRLESDWHVRFAKSGFLYRVNSRVHSQFYYCVHSATEYVFANFLEPTPDPPEEMYILYTCDEHYQYSSSRSVGLFSSMELLTSSLVKAEKLTEDEAAHLSVNFKVHGESENYFIETLNLNELASH